MNTWIVLVCRVMVDLTRSSIGAESRCVVQVCSRLGGESGYRWKGQPLTRGVVCQPCDSSPAEYLAWGEGRGRSHGVDPWLH